MPTIPRPAPLVARVAAAPAASEPPGPLSDGGAEPEPGNDQASPSVAPSDGHQPRSESTRPSKPGARRASRSESRRPSRGTSALNQRRDSDRDNGAVDVLSDSSAARQRLATVVLLVLIALAVLSMAGVLLATIFVLPDYLEQSGWLENLRGGQTGQ